MEEIELLHQNKLGLSEEEMQEVESKIIDLKTKLINPGFTFDAEEYGILYLIRLHDFLYGDLYYDEDKMSEQYTLSDRETLDIRIKKILVLIDNRFNDIRFICDLIQELKDCNIFYYGNETTTNIFFENYINYKFDIEDEYAIELKNNILQKGRTF